VRGDGILSGFAAKGVGSIVLLGRAIVFWSVSRDVPKPGFLYHAALQITEGPFVGSIAVRIV
jgi:hypothetical protein